jgi:hypothetical protein
LWKFIWGKCLPELNLNIVHFQADSNVAFVDNFVPNRRFEVTPKSP